MLHAISSVPGDFNLTRVTTLDMRSAPAAKASSRTVDCHGALPASLFNVSHPVAPFATQTAALNGTLYVVYRVGLEHNAITKIELATGSCELVYNLGTGMLTNTAFDEQTATLYATVHSQGVLQLHSVRVHTKEASSVRLGDDVQPTDLVFA